MLLIMIPIMIPAVLVSIAMIGAAFAIFLAPMPRAIRHSLAAAFGYFGILYAVIQLTDMGVDDRTNLARLGLLFLAAIIIACVLAWRWGVNRWRQ